MKIKAIVFDLGNVIIDWNPEYLFRKIFSDPETCRHFLTHICPLHWHGQQDAGRNPEEATAELIQQYPEWEEPVRAYYSRWKEMFRGTIPGSVEILQELKEKGYTLYALSNWNRELFHQTREEFSFLSLFHDILLSSDVKLIKPDERIYKILLERFSLQPEQTLFIDDRKDNVEAAAKLGMYVYAFTAPSLLRQQLKDWQIL